MTCGTTPDRPLDPDERDLYREAAEGSPELSREHRSPRAREVPRKREHGAVSEPVAAFRARDPNR